MKNPFAALLQDKKAVLEKLDTIIAEQKEQRELLNQLIAEVSLYAHKLLR
jgi:hypothetical protein